MPSSASLTPSRRTHAERSQATQQLIIDAAIAVIDAKGLQGASMFEIAKAAGLSPGALQHHFPSKAALITRAATELVHADDQHGGLPIWAAPEVPLRDRARQAVRNAWDRMYSQPRYIAMWSIFLGLRVDAELTAHIASERAKLRQRTLDGFMATFPELRQHADGEAFADMVFSTLRGMGLLAMFVKEPSHFDGMLESLSRSIECAAMSEGHAPVQARAAQQGKRTT